VSSLILSERQIIDVVKYKWLWIGISLMFIIPGIIAMIYSTAVYPTHSPLRLGIDFTGGTLLQYGFDKDINTGDVAKIRENLIKVGVESPVIQVEKASGDLSKVKAAAPAKGSSLGSTAPVNNESIKTVVSIRTRFLSSDVKNNESAKVNQVLQSSIGSFVPLQVSSIGPTLGAELFKNAVAALLIAFVLIVGYLTLTFKFDYAIFALIALFHDALFVCGLFSIFGLFLGIEIDSLFITAVLTVIGFSVHDTIVVFDRIRENSRFLAKKMSFNDIVNASVNQTLARSINTSLTVVLTLTALYLFGGSTTKNFILAMLLGIMVGTYSSIFNASTLLAMWRSRATATRKETA
jgi:preprotein translocase subunit SecF